jgi:hypothetical protein
MLSLQEYCASRTENFFRYSGKYSQANFSREKEAEKEIN